MSNRVVLRAERQLEFLRKLQRLLDEGDFSSTYTFALLQALADLSVERDNAARAELAVSIDDIAVKFVEYYWRQAFTPSLMVAETDPKMAP